MCVTSLFIELDKTAKETYDMLKFAFGEEIINRTKISE
jgi:hypothetical protein